MTSRPVRACAIALLLAVSTPCIAQQPAPNERDPAAVAQRFDEIKSRLDEGGDLILIANVEGLLEEQIGKILGVIDAIPQADPDAAKAVEMARKVDGYLRKCGLYAINGFGMSVVPQADGMNQIKSFLSRDGAVAGTPLWRGLTGFKQRRLMALDYAPADAVMVSASSIELGQIWVLIRDGIREIGTDETVAALDQWIEGSAAMTGATPDALFASLGDEAFFSLQLSREKEAVIPMGNSSVTIPTPSILIGLAVKDKTIPDLITQRLTAMGLTPITQEFRGASLSSMTLPVPSPIPVSPTIAVRGNMMLIGSDVGVIKSALSAAEEGTGLASTDEFKKAFAGLAVTNNGFSFISARAGAALREYQSSMLKAASGPDGNPASAMVAQLQNSGLMGNDKLQGASVTQNWKSGIVTSGRSRQGGREMIMGYALIPIGIAAAVAIPSFQKSRTAAQQNACINNLRQIDAAKEQWAMAGNKAEGDVADLEGIAEYIRGNALPLCPQGGDYTVNAIGDDPECSLPAHRLR
ncbi:MAG: hypothetical protein O2923_11440 [Verrucomicrobia bacterium]|nr:hypothetical protein [Verrucomicrobiota bacterium]MDA1086946.1 hypothetical protein [Verrucomicrobiota bacterium]